MRIAYVSTCLFLACAPAGAQQMAYDLPEPLRLAKGIRVRTVDEWERIRRPEILDLFRQHMYGYAPGRPDNMSFRVLSSDAGALGGLATRKQVRIQFEPDTSCHIDILLYLPNSRMRPSPVFLGLNFYGNQTISDDPGILITGSWARDNADFGVVNNRATTSSRGVRKSRWPVERMLQRGYGLATVYCGDIDPDFDDGFHNGVHGLFDNRDRNESSWGTIAAWAWGLQRAMDYLVTDEDVDWKRVAVMGHSRLGKASLWAGATDERFAMVISNDSGEGGAALTRNEKGESLADITSRFPHWFCGRYKSFAGRIGELPFDQHMLLALIAPRLLYVASAEEDLWADPEGEFLATYHAGAAYRLYGRKGIGVKKMPPVSHPVQRHSVGYHVRPGVHDVTGYDWEQWMNFADRHWKKVSE